MGRHLVVGGNQVVFLIICMSFTGYPDRNRTVRCQVPFQLQFINDLFNVPFVVQIIFQVDGHSGRHKHPWKGFFNRFVPEDGA